MDLGGMGAVSEIFYMTNKKKKTNIKSKKKSIKREKAYGDPMVVRPVSEYYNLETGEIYPKIFFRESLWTRLKRFFGL
jgi:hypothetical protein